MKIALAGYNIDTSLTDQIPDGSIVTPETISAAYARISRSSKSVTELREEAKSEVENARKSNENIIFDMGHGSIAEHAVFNFDIIGISRYLTEIIQKTRFASFTEKSQRYVTLKGDFVVPEEIKNTAAEKDYRDLIERMNNLYRDLYEAGIKFLEKENFSESKKLIRGKAKEDARYFLPLATETQMGMTVNARSLERLLRRLDKTGLKEADELRENLLKHAKEAAPSVIRYTKADDFEKFIPELPRYKTINKREDIKFVKTEEYADEKVIASLIFEHSNCEWDEIFESVKKLEKQSKISFLMEYFKRMEPFNTVPRAFEVCDFAFEALMSSSCFAQLKRHRPATVITQKYSPESGVVIPELIKKLKMNDRIEIILKKSENLFYELEKIKKGLGSYVLCNGHKVNVLFKANLREFYHFSRLRSDKHAQWEIREISLKIDEKFKEFAPLTSLFMMGKDKFAEVKKNGIRNYTRSRFIKR
ncbi:MAG: thymidylate synthase (FAD) [Candidatus Cloacimonadota bacterium]|nr:MAG: thymidylate synthase (FAD) [Candidatus Cloacimonadota bacterium]